MITALLIAQPIVMLLWWYPDLTILATRMSYSVGVVAQVEFCISVVRLAGFFWSSVKVAYGIGVRGGEGSSSDG